jgi:hypothetical protein
MTQNKCLIFKVLSEKHEAKHWIGNLFSEIPTAGFSIFKLLKIMGL